MEVGGCREENNQLLGGEIRGEEEKKTDKIQTQKRESEIPNGEPERVTDRALARG